MLCLKCANLRHRSCFEESLTTTTSNKETLLQDFCLIINRNPEEMFPQYYIHSNAFSIVNTIQLHTSM